MGWLYLHELGQLHAGMYAADLLYRGLNEVSEQHPGRVVQRSSDSSCKALASLEGLEGAAPVPPANILCVRPCAGASAESLEAPQRRQPGRSGGSCTADQGAGTAGAWQVSGQQQRCGLA